MPNSTDMNQAEVWIGNETWDSLPYKVGDRIRVNHWVVPRKGAWKYGTVLEVCNHVASVDWGEYTSITNLRVCHHEKVST